MEGPLLPALEIGREARMEMSGKYFDVFW